MHPAETRAPPEAASLIWTLLFLNPGVCKLARLLALVCSLLADVRKPDNALKRELMIILPPDNEWS